MIDIPYMCYRNPQTLWKKKTKKTSTAEWFYYFSSGIKRLQLNTVRLLTSLIVHHEIDSRQHSTSIVHRQSDLRPVDLYI